MFILVSIVAGIVPMLVYPLILAWFDRYEKEPFGLIAATFLWGFVPAALFALLTQVVLDIPLSIFFVEGGLSYNLVSASIVAPVTEEIFKGFALLLIFLFARKEFDSLFDGILYGSLVGFGFAAIENILYFAAQEGGFGALLFLIFMRSFLFGLNHAFFTSLTGMGFAIARLSRSLWAKIAAPLGGLLLAMAAHGIHNAGATLAAETGGAFALALLADLTGVVFVFVVVLLAIRRERAWLVAQLRDEVRQGTLSEAQYEVVCSPRRRAQVRGRSLSRGDLGTWRKQARFFQACTELAYKKHQNARVGEAGAPAELITKLRTQVAAMSRQF